MDNEDRSDLFDIDDNGYSEGGSDGSRLDDVLDTVDDARDIAKKIKDRKNASDELKLAENNATNNGLNEASANVANKAGKAGSDAASKAGTDAAGKVAEGAAKAGSEAATAGASGSGAAAAGAGGVAATGSGAAASAAGSAAATAGTAAAGTAAGTGAGAAGGAAAGAAAGSVAPGVGTAIGAAVGVVAGALSNKKVRSTIALVIIGLIAGIAVLMAAPMMMIASIDYNLQESLGFGDIIAILEEQAEYITAEFMSKGEVPSKYAGDLAKNGIEIGQVTASGEFVRTDTYIADLDEERETASNGVYFNKNEDGELVALFDGQVVEADNFVAVVESNPKMYAAYSDALDISARYFYSSDVNDVYKNMGLSRGSFNGWKGNGTSEENEEEFNKLINKILDNNPDATVNGYIDDENVKTTSVSGDSADSIINSVADNTTGSDSNAKAAQLLNTAISSSEPYKAASAFMAIEEPIQRARIDGDGPVNELMNLLTNANEVSYTDVETGQSVKKKLSILDTGNFIAATSGGGYYKDEAANFSRDRVLNVTSESNTSVIGDTTVSTDGNKKSNSVLTIGWGDSADKDILSKASDSVAIAVVDDSRELFTSVVGGNRVVEGGSFLANSISGQTLGAMPSDATTIAEYHQEVEEVMARRKAADRATRSPFDISTPNTFFGSLVYNFGSALIKNSNGTLLSNVNTIADYAGSSVASIVSNTFADGENDDTFTTIAGDCDTIKSAEGTLEGDLYCTSHNTISTKYMKNTAEDWKKAGIGVDENGKIEENSAVAQFIALGMGRDVTVGVMSSDVCERWKDIPGNQSIWGKIVDAISNAVGLYKSCGGVDNDVANGAKYTLSGDYKSNVEKYSGFVLYDTVASLLEEKESSTSLFKKEYYAKYPKDNSAAGVISRRSGMSEEEAKVAINYASYLNAIANYDASVRYAFGKTTFVAPQKDLIKNDEIIQIGLYCVWCKKMQYADVRNRNFAA